MLIQWDEAGIRWFQHASAYTGFHRELAALLLPVLEGCQTLCDLGCGIGLIDLVLAEHFPSITCVDQDLSALAILEREAGRRGITRLQTVRADARQLTGRWDAVLLSFFGLAEECVPLYLPLCRKKLISIVHGSDQGHFGPREYRLPKCNFISRMQDTLDREQRSYDLREVTLEYGQPFLNWEEACQFASRYTQNAPVEAVESYLDRHLTETGDPRFPYYLPRQKTIGIFAVDP